jgi:hypothetical protein
VFSILQIDGSGFPFNVLERFGGGDMNGCIMDLFCSGFVEPYQWNWGCRSLLI